MSDNTNTRDIETITINRTNNEPEKIELSRIRGSNMRELQDMRKRYEEELKDFDDVIKVINACDEKINNLQNSNNELSDKVQKLEENNDLLTKVVFGLTGGIIFMTGFVAVLFSSR